MARATASETSDRIDALQGMILEGEPNTACLTLARQQWGISRAQGYKLLKRAWTQIKDDVDETGIDRLELLAWSIQTLMSAAGQASQQRNPGAVVACIKQLDWMTGLGIIQTLGQGGAEVISRLHRWRGLIRSMYGTCTKLVAPPLIQLASSSVNPFVPGMMKRLFEA